MFNSKTISSALTADILSISKTTLLAREKKGVLKSHINVKTGKKEYNVDDLLQFDVVNQLKKSKWATERVVKPLREYRSIELFAGTGGLAIGLEKAGFEAIALNEVDKNACNTLRTNRPDWNVLEGDIAGFSFKKFNDIDLLAGGFPCQAFSYAGNKRGFEDTRGTLFFEFARAIKEAQPKVFLGENVKGLLRHDEGRTLETIKAIIKELGYTLIEPRVLKAIFYEVPQKRERLMLVGIRNDVFAKATFSWPEPSSRIMVLKDALKAGRLYPVDVPTSAGQTYPIRKKEILSFVPQGGYWKDLSDDLQREYMMKSYFLGGGKTGMARRLSWEEPSLTLTCSPAQKQTERCHPEETRPLTIREYARVQTFPDAWVFEGAVSSQYKQIGNAVPVNLAYAMGRRLVSLLNNIEQASPIHLKITG
jgi:DNA (cytosine-5)-methyltransferase 1